MTMIYAVLSDVHGNLPALEAVLQEARAKGAEHFLLLGDYCLSHPFPDECLSRIFALENATVIRGNEEGYLENLQKSDPAGWTDGQMQISYWTYRHIRPENLGRLLRQPESCCLDCHGVKLHLAHASKAFIGDGEVRRWRPTQVAQRYAGRSVTPQQFTSDAEADLLADEELLRTLEGLEDGIYLFGHTHLQWQLRSPDGRKLLLNPGSCGLPMDCIPGSVPYALLEVREDGTWRSQLCRVPFDSRAAAEAICQSSAYREARVWSEVILKEIPTAREHISFFLRFTEEYARSIGDPRRPFSVDTWETAYEAWNRTLPPEDPSGL